MRHPDHRLMPFRGPHTCAGLVFLLALALAACSTPAINVPAVAPADLPRLQQLGNFPHEIYRVEAGDTLHIRFPFHSEMDQDVVVQPDGKIAVMRVGPLVVAGMTTTELEKLLQERTSDRLRDPEVVVTIRQFSEKAVYVGGEVGKPGTLVYRRGLTPLQAILAAGGFKEGARLDSVILIRTGGGNNVENMITRKLDLNPAIYDGKGEPVHLAPHDVVYVPRTEIADAGLWVKQHITDLFPIFRGATLPIPIP